MTDMIDPATTRDQYRGWQRNLARHNFDKNVLAALTLVPEVDHGQLEAVLAEAADAYDLDMARWGGGES